MNLFDLKNSFTPVLAANVSPHTLILIGAFVTAVVSIFTFSNWRLGVKIAFVMVLLEGALRKWFIPGAQELAYFAKDVLLIGAYLRFFFFPEPEMRAWKLQVPGGIFAMLCMVVSFSALNPNIGSMLLAAYGVKIYIFYLPLAFMIPFLFRSREEFESQIFWYAMLAVPICLLGIAQYAVPGSSFLNVNAHGGDGTSMGWDGSKIRVTGSFSYITGHTTFVVVFFSLHLALLLNKLPKWKWVCLMASTGLLVGNAFMSGSRSTVILLAFTGLSFLIASLSKPVGTGGSAILKIGTAGAVVLWILSLLFSEAREQWTARATSSDDTVYFRVVEMPAYSIETALTEGGMFGFGIGMTHPAPDRLRNALNLPRPKSKAPTFDVEIGQVLVELGVVGWISWYTIRFMVLFFSFKALRGTPPGILRSVIVASIIIQLPHLMLGVVLNHTANFLVFGFFGLAMIPLLKPAVERQALGHGGNSRFTPHATSRT
jgi:hypothetical protein